MTTNVSIHLNDTQPEVRVRENYAVIGLDDNRSFHTLVFKNEAQLRGFAESILKQLEQKEEVSA